MGCPHYVVIDRKPENGMELQNIACGKTGVLLGLKLVKSANISNESGGEAAQSEIETSGTYGTKVLKELCRPWCGYSRLCCADSYFASVDAAISLLRMGMGFTGVVKNGTKEYPVSFFNSYPLYEKGDWVTLFATETIDGVDMDIAALCWVDRHRRQFVSTVGDVKSETTQERTRWRQFEDGACPTECGVRMPLAVAQYYDVAGIIDRHNRVRQDGLDLEKMIGTHNWALRLGTTILGMIMTDTRHVYNFGRGGRKTLSPYAMFCRLGEELVDNDFDNAGVYRHDVEYYEEDDNNEDVWSAFPELQPTSNRTQSGPEPHSPTRLEQMKCASGCGKKLHGSVLLVWNRLSGLRTAIRGLDVVVFLITCRSMHTTISTTE